MTTEVELFFNNTVVERLPVTERDVVQIITTGPQGPQGIPGTSIDPLPSRPTTLNEVIAGGVTLGLWP